MNDLVRVVLSVGIIIMFIPGLIIEPGPLSEGVALSALLGIWGLDGGSDE